MHTSAASPRFDRSLTDALTAAGEPLLFGVRLWASVCLALFVAFWLELDNPFWAGSSAAIVCLPQLGASLRKGWFRMIGTVIGATMIVVLTACFPQDRIAFLGLLALWGAICAFTATLLPNFASYSASLAGYTAAIIAADVLGATGGASSEVFLLAVWRASEICIGIACAGIVLAGTDLGGAQRRLAASLANLAGEIAGRFTRTLAPAGPQLPDTQTERREFLRRVIALEPMIDQALGESSHVRYHASTLQTAVRGLFGALDGWSAVAVQLNRVPDDGGRQAAEPVLRAIPLELRSTSKPLPPTRWMADPRALQRACEEAARALLSLPAGTPIAAAPRRPSSQGAGRTIARARSTGAARRCSRRASCPPARLPTKRARLDACCRQRGTRVPRNRRNRAFLGRHGLAGRRRSAGPRRNHATVAVAER